MTLGFIFFDPLYLLIMAPGLLLALGASALTKSTFNKYSRVLSSRGLTGAQAAREMMRGAGLYDVNLERVHGHLTDHYDPRSRTLRLSEATYDSPSVAAVGVACHEVGHAIQHASGYAFLGMRSALVPVTQFCSTFYVWVLIGGALLQSTPLMLAGVIMCAAAVLFALVTLPVEWDASRRAKKAMLQYGLVSPQEAPHASKVLNAAFLTYLASAVTSLLLLLYWLLRLGVLGGRSND